MARASGALEGPRIIAWATVALAAITAVLLGVYGTGEPGVRVMIRATARTSVVLFTAAFTASSAAQLWPRPPTKWMLRNRRYLGLSFAVSHAVHLLFIVYAAAVVGFLRVNAVALIGGGIAYVFIAAMAATSFDGAVTWLGRDRWQWLHTIGAYYVWFIFFQSYVPRAVFQSAAYVPLALLLIGGLVVRLVARRRDTRRAAVISYQ
jgi:sulfoxide reductase heme-binding subunit YedZ